MGTDAIEGVFLNVKDYEDLKEKSNLILKVKVTNDRITYLDTTKTKVLVEEVYQAKDTSISKKEMIYIYEPAAFLEYPDQTYNSIDGYQLMEAGKEYYVFLNPLKTAKGYKKSSEEEKTFLPSSTNFSVYPLEEGNTKVLDNDKMDSGEYRYKDIKTFEILSMNGDILKQYRSIKKKLLSEF